MIKAMLFALFIGLLLVGCGESDQSNPDRVEDATADGVNWLTLQKRNGIMYLPTENTPFNGLAVSWYGRGRKQFKVTLKDGKMEGLWTKWNINGQKTEQSNYKKGKKEGLCTKWYWNGQKKSETIFKNDKRDGLQTEWYPNGQKQVERNFKDGKLMYAEFWNPNGEKSPVKLVLD